MCVEKKDIIQCYFLDQTVSNFFLPQAIIINMFYVTTQCTCVHTHTHMIDIKFHKHTFFYHLQCNSILFSISVKKHQSQPSKLIHNLLLGHSAQFEKHFPRFSPSDLHVTNSHISPSHEIHFISP